MLLVWDENGWEDYLWWQNQDRKVLKRINVLLADIKRTGSDGIGKPEPVKHDFAGYWSRRITDEHRLACKIAGQEIRVAACRVASGARYAAEADSREQPTGAMPSRPAGSDNADHEHDDEDEYGEDQEEQRAAAHRSSTRCWLRRGSLTPLDGVPDQLGQQIEHVKADRGSHAAAGTATSPCAILRPP